MHVRAVSYNIHSAIGRDRAFAPERILRVIRELDAGIVGLQEVDARIGEPQRFDQFRFFGEMLGLHSIAGPNIVEHGGDYGNVLLTRWPVEQSRLIKLGVARREPRGAICAILRCGDARLQVINTHFGLRRAERREQARRLLDEARAHDGPTLFMGDFNVWRRGSYALARLGAPADRARTPGTFTSRWPLIPLDRVWTRPLAHLVTVRAVHDELTMTASDHLPLEATVDLGGSAA